MSRVGGLFGRIALKKELVKEGELLLALRTQEELRAFGVERPLGVVLVSAGALTEEEVETILRLQKLNERHTAAKQFGRVALRNGLIDASQLEAALKLRCEDVTTLEAPGPGNRRRQARAAPRGSTIALLRFFNESRRFSHRL